MKFNVMVLIAFCALLVILLLQNTQFLTLRFLIWTVRVPEIAAILLLVMIGFVSGYLTAKTGKKKSK